MQKPAAVRINESETMTINYSGTILNQNIRMFDVLGWTKNANYTAYEWTCLLKGCVPNGTNMQNGIDPYTLPDENLAIDASIFMLSNSISVETVALEVASLAPFIKHVRNKIVVFCVTKLDQHTYFQNANLRAQFGTTSAIDNNEKFKQLKLALIAELSKHIENPIIMPVVSYHAADQTRNVSSIMELTAKNVLLSIIESVRKMVPMDTEFDLFNGEPKLVFK